MQSRARHLVILGTGGTIAGEATSADNDLSYRSAVRPIGDLVASLGAPPGVVLESEQVAQLDSKDMDFATWRLLAVRATGHLARREVVGVVVTHGSDTLEETAYFLQRVLAPVKPVVLTAAMRPATSRQADGPQNLADAMAVAITPGAGGVVVAVAGSVHAAFEVRKLHPQRLDAFGSGDAGPLARVAGGKLRMARLRTIAASAAPLDLALLPDDASAWPMVAIVTSSAGADPRSVRALVEAGADGIVVAATGNGTIHQALEAPLRDAMARGCAVLRATRCIAGSILEPAPLPADALPSAGALTPQQARVELIVRLLEQRRGARA
jgi:L-asparaginase